jgi:endo-1,4-beta-xylanase
METRLQSKPSSERSQNIDRRRLLAAGTAALTTCLALSGTATGATNELGTLADRRGLFFGAAVQSEQLEAEQDLAAAVLRECSSLTPEVALGWAAVEPGRGQLNLSSMDRLADLAVESGKVVQGHALLWHRAIPDWAKQALADERNWRPIELYFASVIPRYRDVIGRWNVVNEPIDVDAGVGGLRQNTFLAAFGADYIRRSLELARSYSDHAQLFINEYSLEYSSDEEDRRRVAFLKLIERLKYANAPLDGIGLQSHLDLRKGSISAPAISAFIHELDQLGLAVVVSELDVKEAAYTAPREVRDALVADEVRRYLDVVLDQRCVAGVTTWGLSDRHSWLEIDQADYARFPGAWANGEGPGVNRGLPFDASMQPKPMYQAIAAALRSAPRRERARRNEPLTKIRRKSLSAGIPQRRDPSHR